MDKLANNTVDGPRRALLALPIAAVAIYAMSRSDPPKADIRVKEVLVEEAKALIAAGALIVDVRERTAYEARHLAGALLAPVSQLESSIPKELAAAKAMPIVVYCGDGARSGPAGTAALNRAGYAHAVNLKGGLEGWVAAGMPVEQGRAKA